jgi:hypothetical protein
MNTIRKTFVIASALLVMSCSKDDDKDYPTEDSLQEFHTTAGFTSTTNFINAGNYEFGLVFAPLVDGEMKSINVKLPDINSSLQVAIWDYETKVILKSEVVNVNQADVQVKKKITGLNLEKDKKYLISMNSNDWYKKHKADNTNAAYPITAGNIKYFQYRWISSSNQIFPTNVSLDYDGGDLSFDFQRK